MEEVDPEAPPAAVRQASRHSGLRSPRPAQGGEQEGGWSDSARERSFVNRPSLDGKEMQELVDGYRPRQVIELLATSGVEYLGSFRLREGVVMKGFKGQSVIWEVHDAAADADWRAIWEKRLEKASASTPFFPCNYWRAEAYVVTMKNAAHPVNEGVLYPIVRMLEARSCPASLFSTPLVRAVVRYKWQWARNVVFIEFCIFFVWLATFLLHAIFYEESDLRRGFWYIDEAGSQERLATVTSFLSTAFMLPFSYISLCEVWWNGLKNWLTFWNLFDVLAQLCQMLCFFIYFFGMDVTENTYAVMLSTQTVLLVLKIQYFARAVLQVEVAILDNLNQVLQEAAMFLFLWLTTVVSFSIALHSMFKRDLDLGENDEIEFYYGNVLHSCFTLFGSMFKRFTYDPLLDSERSIAVTMLFSVFLFLNTVTFYNLIASIVVSSHKKIKQRSQARLDTGRAQMIVELETAMPNRFLKRARKPYIHFLRLVPPEDIDMQKLWTSLGYSGQAMESQKLSLTKKLHSTEQEIMREIEEMSQRIAAAKQNAGLRVNESKK